MASAKLNWHIDGDAMRHHHRRHRGRRYHHPLNSHTKIWKYTILLISYDSIAIRSNWNDMVNRKRVLNKMGVKYFSDGFILQACARERASAKDKKSAYCSIRIVQRIMRTKCECQRILNIITLVVFFVLSLHFMLLPFWLSFGFFFFFFAFLSLTHSLSSFHILLIQIQSGPW